MQSKQKNRSNEKKKDRIHGNLGEALQWYNNLNQFDGWGRADMMMFGAVVLSMFRAHSIKQVFFEILFCSVVYGYYPKHCNW